MTTDTDQSPTVLTRDLTAGLVVFFIALPLCLGVALASNAPLLSGVLAGIIGGILVGMLSGSQSSITGPAAGLTAVVAAQIITLGSFQTFLTALVIAGLIQIVLGLAQAGSLAAFFPSSVIKGLLAAIGIILILKQIPHVLGHDLDPEGDLAFFQRDHRNTFSALANLAGNMHPGSATIGLISIALLFVWNQWERRKQSPLPIALVVVLLGIGLNLLFRQFGGRWVIEAGHLVQVPILHSLADFRQHLQHPDFSQWTNPAVYLAAVTIAAIASLESLVNLEAIDKLDPQKRISPPSRQLWAQGVGNVVSGLIGGLPMTTVVVRSSVSLNSGSKSRLAAISQGVLLLISVTLFPAALNLIPLSCLAAILLVTGVKLASPALFQQMWSQGRYQFLPFLATVVSIVLTDLMTGILIGLAVSAAFILSSNVRRPLRRTVEKHPGAEVIRIKLATQVSFLNRAALSQALNEVPRGGHILIDARSTDFIDPDVVSLIRDFKEQTAPARDIEVSLRGFRNTYELEDQTQYVAHSSRDVQSTLTPQQVLDLMKEGHERFRTGQRISRDLTSQVIATASGQHPLAVVVSCIDSRTPAELLFDLGVGDMFSVRVAGNITSRKVMGSVEYACNVAGAKLILVLGHTRCGAVTAAVNLASAPETILSATGCEHLEFILRDIQKSVDPTACQSLANLSPTEKEEFVNNVARRNVARVVEEILQESPTLNELVQNGRVAIVGTIYDVATGNLEFLPTAGSNNLQAMSTA